MVPVSLPPSSPRMEFHPGDVIAPKGFWADGLNAGLRDQSLDMALLVSQESATFSGMFTTNAVRAAPVELSRAVHQQGLCRAVIINSKNANALTGALGTQDAQAMQAQVARELGLDVGDVAVASTGVIGWPLPMDRVRAGIFQLAARFREGDAGDGGAAAQAILTTDTATKTAACTVALSGGGRNHWNDGQRIGHDSSPNGDDAGLFHHRCRHRERRFGRLPAYCSRAVVSSGLCRRRPVHQ